MANITLRSYIKAIEELIENGQMDEAINHCLFILEKYPKNLATYRLLGKSHLEEKHYSDAGDIFQRVLSSVPDDFISHVGMSIILEDEGNSDGAISHMERAFEAQPSNRAVQDELKRLYGQREGFSPPKVRLTRAALARMYSHGDLFNQAIAELRSAIKEKGPRPELLILLAEMYAKTEQDDEALKSSNELLEQLPYCLYANHLIADLLIKQNREQEASAHMKKVEELDPYQMYTSAGENPDLVAEEKVMLAQLILDGGELDVQESPIEEKSIEELTVESPDVVAEDLPDWLSVPPEEEESEETKAAIDAPMQTSELKALQELAPEAAEKDGDLPDWMQELRSEEEDAEGKALDDTSPNPFTADPEEDSQDEEIKDDQDPADDGDDKEIGEDEDLAWLEGLAVNEGAQEEELVTDPKSREEAAKESASADSEEDSKGVERRSMTWWLDELEKTKDIEAVDRTEEFEEIEAPLEEISPSSDESDVEESVSDENIESSIDKELEASKIEISPENAQAATKDISESISDDELELESEEELESSGNEQTPEWLKDLADEIDDGTPASADSSKEAFQETPEWLDELRQDEPEMNEDEEPSLPEEESADGKSEENSDASKWLLEESEESLDEGEESDSAAAELDSNWISESGKEEEQIQNSDEIKEAAESPNPRSQAKKRKLRQRFKMAVLSG